MSNLSSDKIAKILEPFKSKIDLMNTNIKNKVNTNDGKMNLSIKILNPNDNTNFLTMGIGEKDVYFYNSTSKKYLKSTNAGELSFDNKVLIDANGFLNEKGARVYSPNNKPSAVDIGAIAVTNGKANKSITVNRGDGTEDFFAIGIGSNYGYLYNSVSDKYFQLNNSGAIGYNGKTLIDANGYILENGVRVYSINNKPSAADLGVLGKNSDGTLASLTVGNIKLSQQNITMGKDVYSSGICAISLGCNIVGVTDTLQSSGDYSVALGGSCIATKTFSIATGKNTKSIGETSLTGGYQTTASGTNSVALGNGTTASADDALSIGYQTTASGANSMASGHGNVASGEQSAVFGLNGKATQNNTFVIGTQNEASANSAFAGGFNSKATGQCSFAFGSNGDADQEKTTASGYGAFAIGAFSNASGYNSFAGGSAVANHPEGSRTAAGGTGTFAFGGSNRAVQNFSFCAGGTCNVANGNSSFATGTNNTANGNSSFVAGYGNNASGEFSVAIGQDNVANGKYSVALGYHTVANYQNEVVMGLCNIQKDGNSGNWKDLLTVGCGTDANRNNKFRIADNGVFANSPYNSTGADYAELFEWADGNPNNEDRRGKFVTLEGEKIKIASNPNDYILGVISGNPSMIGNTSEDQWKDMYVVDQFGSVIYDEVEVNDYKIVIPKPQGEEETEEEKNAVDGKILIGTHIEKQPRINPKYNADQKYIPRAERPEWSAVGMLGQLIVIDDGTCKVNSYCECDEGIATASETGYRVITRISDNLIKIVLK